MILRGRAEGGKDERVTASLSAVDTACIYASKYDDAHITAAVLI